MKQPTIIVAGVFVCIAGFYIEGVTQGVCIVGGFFLLGWAVVREIRGLG